MRLNCVAQSHRPHTHKHKTKTYRPPLSINPQSLSHTLLFGRPDTSEKLMHTNKSWMLLAMQSTAVTVVLFRIRVLERLMCEKSHCTSPCTTMRCLGGGQVWFVVTATPGRLAGTPSTQMATVLCWIKTAALLVFPSCQAEVWFLRSATVLLRSFPPSSVFPDVIKESSY